MGSLRSTAALLVAALLFAILPAAVLTLRESYAYVFPACSGTLERVEVPVAIDARYSIPERLVLDRERDGLLLHLHADVDLDGSVVSARMIRVGTDAAGRRCECGRLPLRAAGVSALGGEVGRLADGTLVYIDARWGFSSDTFRTVERPVRHLQRDRLFALHNVPALLALLAIGVVGGAAMRARKAVTYLMRQHAWLDARLGRDGRVQADNGEMLGVVDEEVRRLAPSALLVAPEARKGAGAYRDVPLLARAHLAIGSHEDWRRGTTDAFRRARTSAAISTACAAVAVVALLLGMRC